MTLFSKLPLFQRVRGHSQSSWGRPQPSRLWRPSQHVGLYGSLLPKGHPNRFFQNEVTARDFAQPFTVYKAVLHQGEGTSDPQGKNPLYFGSKETEARRHWLRRQGGPSHYCTLASTHSLGL